MKKRTVKILLGMLITILTFSAFVAPTFAKISVTKKSDFQIVYDLCQKYHKPIKLVEGYSKAVENTITHRKGKNYIVVEKVVSYSRGKYGYSADGGYICYNKTVKKGQKVISYLIYNPQTNYCDDVLWVVDNQTYR